MNSRLYIKVYILLRYYIQISFVNNQFLTSSKTNIKISKIQEPDLNYIIILSISNEVA